MAKVKTVNIAPKWMGIYPLFVEWIYRGTAKQKQLVVDELKRLCEMADRLTKGGK